MVKKQQADDIIAANKQSLRSLDRAITFSKNQFSVILLCCNYKFLHELIRQQLVEIGWGSDKLQTITLDQKTTSLYTTIQAQISLPQPTGLMIVGFELVDEIDDLLCSINQVRDEFRKSYQMPMIFWVNEQILARIWQLAPDFASWAATPIRFEMNPQKLLELLQQETENLFTEILVGDCNHSNYFRLEKIWTNNQIHYAIFQLEKWGIEIEPELKSSLDFVFGIDDYINNRIYSALNNFQKSLHFWEQQENLFTQEKNTELDYKYSLKIAILSLHIGLCFYRLAKQNKRSSKCNLQSAKINFLQSFQILEVTGHRKLVSEFIRQLAEILYILEEWTELQVIAEKSVELHRIYGQKIQLACDYSILAHIALHNSNWMQASVLAYTSLIYLEEAKKKEELNHYLLPLLLEQIYMLTLAEALNHLGKITVAAEYIDQASHQLSLALESSEYQYDIYRYINLLDTLKSLYFQAGCYFQSHIIKQKLNSLDQQYGFLPFIGAGCLKPQRIVTNPALISKLGNSAIALEIIASGREYDINNLIGRISRADQKLIIIHGQSGVGKSSLVAAGLVPALQNRSVGDQIAVPIVIKQYRNWLNELGISLNKAMLKMANQSAIEIESPVDIHSEINIEIIYQQLRKNADNHLITVLIFDQLEEFFFGDLDSYKKQEFDKFISDCLTISFVKVILTLREDYLHRLLNFKYLSSIETIKDNILDSKFRYQLNNFSVENAKQLLEKLTERSQKLHQQSQLKLEPALIDVLLTDLCSDVGEVRPIELQLVGAQLQDKCITTLAQYQPYRPKKLIQEYIQELIQECGQENERSALLVLYLLTDENHKRPFKTHAELKAELSELEDPSNLELILSILVNSGLVVIFHNSPKQYQLIHDYLVDLIRHLEQQEFGLQTQINQLRDKLKNSYQEVERLRSELSKTEEKVILVETEDQQGDNLLREIRELRQREEETQRKIESLRNELREKDLMEKLVESQKKQHGNTMRLNIALKIALTASIIAIFSLAGSIITSKNSEIQTLSASSETLFAAHKGINALQESLKAGQALKKTLWVDASTREKALTAMYQAIYGVKERNRLEGHLSAVKMVSFSNDKSLIASASADTTINLWSPCGLLLKTLSGHESVVNSVNFSPDSQMLVSTSQDKTIKLWSRNGELLKILLGHSAVVNSASFSPDGEIIASASTDKTIKLWSREGKLIKTLLGHQDAVLAVAWSSDGKILASSSSDKTIKLWNRNGKLIKTLPAHEDAVVAIAWSNDGQILASGSLDKKIKLWNREGKLLKTLVGHSGGVIAVNFSRDGHTLASASMDETIKLWHLNGNLLGTLRGHNNWVNSVNFSPDGRSLASAGKDETIILWHWDSLILGNTQENNDWITSISFTPDSSIVAGASRDKTIKLWNRDGKLLKTLVGHDDQIWGVAWSNDGQILASGSKDKTIKLWNRDGKLLRTLIGHTRAINWVSFSPNGQLLASASDDKLVKIWTNEGEIIKSLIGHTRGVNGVAWSPHGDVLASVSLDGMVNIWDQNGKLIKTLTGSSGDGFIGVNFSPDGKTLAVNSNRQVKLWNRQGVLLMSLKGSDEELTGVSFSPDGKILAAGSSQGRIILRKLSDITLESLLRSNCDILNDYLLYNPNMIRRRNADGDQIYRKCKQ
ncbi:MAG: eIF2A-related protein [Dolichospermum sp.]